MKWNNGVPYKDDEEIKNKWKTCFLKKQYSNYYLGSRETYTYWDEIIYSGRVVLLGKTKKYEVRDDDKVVWVDEKDLAFPEYICKETK